MIFWSRLNLLSRCWTDKQTEAIEQTSSCHFYGVDREKTWPHHFKRDCSKTMNKLSKPSKGSVHGPRWIRSLHWSVTEPISSQASKSYQHQAAWGSLGVAYKKQFFYMPKITKISESRKTTLWLNLLLKIVQLALKYSQQHALLCLVRLKMKFMQK